MAQWIGFMVSVETEVKGTYQGVISAATGSEITLIKPFCNGIPCGSSEVVISAEDITNLQLIQKQENSLGESTVTVAKPIPKRAGRTNSCSEIVSSSKTNNYNGSYNYNKSKPIDIEVKHSTYNEASSFKTGTPSKKDKNKSRWNKGWKDEICFGSPLDHIINKDFDFEKNLALFDKQAIWDEINSQKPDVVKHADFKKGVNKYRHDENVITTIPTVYRQITVPKQEFCEYVTDDGLIIPSIPRSLRTRLWAAADALGFSKERRIELMGRAAAEMTLQLVGGGHRLNPHNTHQCPTVVLLCGCNRQGAMGINAARHLASHGVNTIVYLTSADAPEVQKELALYKLTKNKIITTVSKLPQLTDLIIVSLCEESDNPTCHTEVAEWTNSNKAAVLALDPPATGTPSIVTRFSLVPVLPLAHTSDNGKIYLCNLGFPIQIFHEVGIKYKSPFGSKFVIPLHLNDDI